MMIQLFLWNQMYGDKGEVLESEYILPLGVADIKREGKDVTIVSFGKIIKEAYKAADHLYEEGIEEIRLENCSSY